MNDVIYTCRYCGLPITADQRWEYWTMYVVGTPEAAKDRIHGTCMRELIRGTISALGAVPEELRDTDIALDSHSRSDQ